MAYPSQVEAQRYTPSRLQTPRPASGYDPFYSPILVRLEAVFNQIGVTDEGCRERLVCSMYKNPTKYSPHSNLVSAELSRQVKAILLLYKLPILRSVKVVKLLVAVPTIGDEGYVSPLIFEIRILHSHPSNVLFQVLELKNKEHCSTLHKNYL